MAVENSMGPRPEESHGVVVVVGRRRSARSAVRTLGFELIELDTKPRTEQARGGFGGGAKEALETVRSALENRPPAAVVAVAEGAVPTAAALRNFYGLPGIGSLAALRCHDKLVMKRAVIAAGIPCAPWSVVTRDTTAEELIDRLGLPLVLKVPVSSGGRGVTMARTRSEVARGLIPGLLAEGFVDGREMSVETLIWRGQTLFRNPTRYLEPRWANVVPAVLAPGDLEAVNALVDAAHRALGVDHGMTHTEVFLTEKGPVFGEIAARPPGGWLMELIGRAYGFDPWRALIEIELGLSPNLPEAPERTAGVWVLHPGVGEVESVRGVEAARSLSGVVRARVSVGPGDQVAVRVGSGQSVGEIVVEAPDHDACVELLYRARSLVSIELNR
jgi:biotin carboxylase